MAPSSCWPSSRPAPSVLDSAATWVAVAASCAKNDAPGRGWASPARAAASVMASADEMRTCDTARARRPNDSGPTAAAAGAGSSVTGASSAPSCSAVVLTAHSRASCPATGSRSRTPDVRVVAPDVTAARAHDRCAARHSALVRLPYTASTRLSPRSTSRALALGAAVAATVASGGCAEDGSVSVPEFTSTGDQVQQFLDDAGAQVETIGEDVRSLTDDSGTLPDDTRTRAEEAVASAQEAADEARAAADEAASATDETRAQAEERSADAEAALEDASAESGDVAGSLSGADAAVRDAIESSRTRVDELRADLEDASGS
ncbi:hypothetical protein OY671_001369 [Metschnikowia pulcherrima]|nr:hypothetical protein OY671_001369 [Metschnikowia pulcherrima]